MSLAHKRTLTGEDCHRFDCLRKFSWMGFSPDCKTVFPRFRTFSSYFYNLIIFSSAFFPSVLSENSIISSIRSPHTVWRRWIKKQKNFPVFHFPCFILLWLISSSPASAWVSLKLFRQVYFRFHILETRVLLCFCSSKLASTCFHRLNSRLCFGKA